MKIRVVTRAGTYRISPWHERALQAPGDDEVRLRGDTLRALAFARSLVTSPGALSRVRALLGEELGPLTRADDDQVIRELATRLAAGRVRVVRLPPPRLTTWGGVGEEAPASAPAPVSQPKKTWIEIELLDMAGNPVAGEPYWIELTDGGVREGRLDAFGRAYFGDIDPGECEVRFPNLDGPAIAAPGKPALPHRDASRLAPPPIKPERPTVTHLEKTWIEIVLIGVDDHPIPGERYRIELPDGQVREGILDGAGRARVDGIDEGSCKVTFPALDGEAWEP